MKNKKNLLLIVGIILLGVGGTLAYFTSTGVFNNIFSTGTYSTRFHEEFTSPSNWMPGDETPKTITVTNDGDINAYVRVCIEHSWLAADGTTELPNHDTTNNIDIAIINADNTDEWTKSGDCYYYNEELAPNETTSSPIKSVTFNPEYEGSVECTTNTSTNTITCESTNTGYDNATYTLTLTAETIQSEGLSTWGIGYSINGSDYSLPDAGSAQTSSGYNTFLRNNITSQGILPEVGFVYNNNTYYVGGDNTYEENKAILDEAFGESNCSTSSNPGTEALIIEGYSCSCDEFDVDLSVEGGILIAHYKTMSSFTCRIDNSGVGECNRYGGYSALGGSDPVLYDTAIEAMEAEGHLIGGDGGDSYLANKATLDSAFGASNCTETNFPSYTRYTCINEGFKATACDDGGVEVAEPWNEDANAAWCCTVPPLSRDFSYCRYKGNTI